MAKSWYLIRTKPQSERLAASALSRDGFELFFPRVRVPRPRGGQADGPLFPGYIFLRYDVLAQNWPSVRRLPGILGWVRFDGVVPPVPDHIITDLARRVDAINGEGGLWTRYRPGDKVAVVSGKMEGLAEVVEEATSPEARVRVLLNFMGRLVPTQVPWHSLQPAGEGHLGTGARRGVRSTRGKGRWIKGFGPRATVGT